MDVDSFEAVAGSEKNREKFSWKSLLGEPPPFPCGMAGSRVTATRDVAMGSLDSSVKEEELNISCMDGAGR